MERLRRRDYVIRGETPAQKNSQTFNARTRTMVKSPQFRRWRDSALMQIRAQGIPERPYPYAEIEILFVHSDLRRRDGDNQLSSVQDLLVAAGVIADDCWTRIGTPRVSHAVGKAARCEIRVFEVAPADWKSRIAEAKKCVKFGSASCFFAGFCGKPHRYAVSRLSKC